MNRGGLKEYPLRHERKKAFLKRIKVTSGLHWKNISRLAHPGRPLWDTLMCQTLSEFPFLIGNKMGPKYPFKLNSQRKRGPGVKLFEGVPFINESEIDYRNAMGNILSSKCSNQ